MKKSMISLALGAVVLAAAGGYLLVRKPADVASAGAAATPAAAGASAGARPAGGGQRAGGGGPISVTIVKAQQRDQVVTFESTGTVSPLSTVDVKPQVSNVITAVHVKEGQFVKRGDLLFSLDKRSDEANLAKAVAQLARDQAALADARRQMARSRELLEQKFISQSAVDSSTTQVETQQAVAAASKAAVEAARVTLGYNRIVAPGAGRVGAINVFAGSYVQPAGPPLLTITQLDPIAVSFSLPQRNLSDALLGLREGKAAVTAQLPDGGAMSAGGDQLRGQLQFVDSVVDQGSGTVKVKAVFDNPKQKLWPGAYVNVSMALQTLKGAIVVPQTAIVTGPRERSVFVVDGDNKAVAKPVELIYSAGSDAVVSGIEAGARVIVDGRENVRPGSIVVERQARPAGAGKGGPDRGARAGNGASAATP